jgi:hypothetical protein
VTTGADRAGAGLRDRWNLSMNLSMNLSRHLSRRAALWPGWLVGPAPAAIETNPALTMRAIRPHGVAARTRTGSFARTDTPLRTRHIKREVLPNH